MPGDTALRLLIDIQARDSARGVIASLAGAFPLLIGSMRMLGTAASEFASGRFLTGLTALKSGLLGLGEAALKLVALFGLVAGAIAIALGVAAVRAAGDFQQGLMRLVTGAGDVTDNMQKMGQAILGISVATGVLTGPLLQAMYQIISAGQRGAQAENTLAVAARGAVVEQANVVDVAKALTTAMTDYGTKTFNATQFMNGYTRAVQLGKITLEELSTTMGPILPLAKNLGISFADVAGAMSTMTNAGIPAARAATSLRFLFQSLENPTAKAEAAMKQFGLSSVALGNELRVSLPGALQMVYNAAKKAGPEGSVPFNRAVSDMIGGQRSLQAYLALTGTHFKTFAADSKAIEAAMLGSKTAVLGWDVAQRNLNVQIDRFKAAGMALLIVLGTALAPLLSRILGQITPLITQFAQWEVRTHGVENAMAAVGGAITSVIGFFRGMAPVLAQIVAFLVSTFMPVWQQLVFTWRTQLKPAWDQFVAALGPAMPALRVIATLLGALVVLTLIVFLKSLAAGLQGAVILFGLLATAVSASMTGMLRALGIISQFVNAVVNFFKWMYNQIVGGSIVPDLINGIVRWFSQLPGRVLSIISGMVSSVVSAFNNLKSQATSAISSLISSAVSSFNTMRSQITSAISGMISSAVGQFNSFKSQVIGILSSMASSLYSSGLALVNNIANGIRAGISNAVAAASAVASAVASVLHHSHPDTGPLRDDHLWGYHFMDNFIMGMQYSMPALSRTATNVAQAVRSAFTLGSTLYATNGGWSNTRPGSWSTGSSPIVVNQITIHPPSIKLDGRELTDRVGRRQAKEVRIMGGGKMT